MRFPTNCPTKSTTNQPTNQPKSCPRQKAVGPPNPLLASVGINRGEPTEHEKTDKLTAAAADAFVAFTGEPPLPFLRFLSLPFRLGPAGGTRSPPAAVAVTAAAGLVFGVVKKLVSVGCALPTCQRNVVVVRVRVAVTEGALPSAEVLPFAALRPCRTYIQYTVVAQSPMLYVDRSTILEAGTGWVRVKTQGEIQEPGEEKQP